MQITFVVSDKLRRAINHHHGRSGQATDKKLKAGFGVTAILGMMSFLRLYTKRKIKVGLGMGEAGRPRRSPKRPSPEQWRGVKT